MRSRPAELGVGLGVLCLSWTVVVPAAAEDRISSSAAIPRLTAVESSLTARVEQVSERYSYEAVHETFVTSARALGHELAGAARPLEARVYALWAGVARRAGKEIERVRSTRAVIVQQTFAGTRDIEWIEHAGARIHQELELAEGCLDGLVNQSLRALAHGAQAKSLASDLMGRRATLARLPGQQREDPLAELAREVRFLDLAAGSAQATAYMLQETLSELAARAWMPLLEAQSRRRAITLHGVELPPALVVAKAEAPWVAGISAGVLLARSMAEFSHRQSERRLKGDTDLADLERIADARDARDKSRVRSLQIEGLSLARDSRRLSSGLERLPELNSVAVFANGKPIFHATRPDRNELDALRDRVLQKSGALNEMLGAVTLLRRQFVFHALAAERGRALRATGKPVDIRRTIQRVFISSRAAHALDGDQRAALERFYRLDQPTLAAPRHLRDAVEALFTGAFTPGGATLEADGDQAARPGDRRAGVSPDAEATLTVARLLAKLSDDRAHVPLRAAKRTVRRWKFPVPGYPERPRDAVQVLADDLTAWAHLPAAVWSEAAFQSLVGSLEADLAQLRDWTTRHRASDGLALDKSVVIRDGMHIEVVVALSAEHDGAVEVELAGDVLKGDGLYVADTPGLLFSTPRLNIRAQDGLETAVIRLRLP